MCARAIRYRSKEYLAMLYDLTQLPGMLPDRYNLAPKQLIPIIREPHRLELVRWGLDMPDPRHTGVNAKAENLGRVYGPAIKERRCVVVVDGFYEWQEFNGKKHPSFIFRTDKQPITFAGISNEGAVITKPSQGCVADLHDRMPILLERDQLGVWLDHTVTDVKDIMKAANANALTMYPGEHQGERRQAGRSVAHRESPRARVREAPTDEPLLTLRSTFVSLLRIGLHGREAQHR